jgi:hypothetical protein
MRRSSPWLWAAWLGSTACQEDPSFFLRWKIAPDLERFALDAGELPELGSAVECSSVGLGQVELVTRTVDGITVDTRSFPCFPHEFLDADGRAGGPELEPGTYDLEVRGLRGSGSPWEREFCESAPEAWADAGICRDQQLLFECPASPESPEGAGDGPGTPRSDCSDACGVDVQCCADWPTHVQELVRPTCRFASATARVEVADDDRPLVGDLVLLAPPECDDGVDNDRDGLTDLSDPACQLDPILGREQDDADISVVSLSVTYLDGNPSVSCPGLGIGSLLVTLDGAELVRTPCEHPQTDLPPLSTSLGPGPHTLEVVGLAPGLEVVPATRVEQVWQIADGEFPPVAAAVDFGPEDFLEPLVGELRFAVAYESSPGQIRSGCAPTPAEGRLCIDELDITVFEDGQEIAVPLQLADDACPIKPIVSVDPVQWAGPDAELNHRYEVAIAARGLVDPPDGCPSASESATEVCFQRTAAERMLLAPGSDAVRVILPRVLDGDDLPPAGCEDCQSSSDCMGCVDCCVDAVCVVP